MLPLLLKRLLEARAAVKRDLNGVRAALKQTMPGSDIQIEGIGDGVMSVDGREIYTAKDLRVGLFTSTEGF